MEATLPRTGGVYSPPAGTKGVSNTTIQSVPYNALVDDLTSDANAARPITAGGTGATSASIARTDLGVAIGSNVQAHDAGLQSIAGLTTAADQMIYTTAADAYATTALTPFARTILDDADAAAVKSTLGLAAIASSGSAADLGSGTIADARLPSSMGGKTFTGNVQFTEGVDFGSAVAASATDLSRHLALWETNYGFSVTSNTLNYVSGSEHVFHSGTNEVARISSSGALTLDTALAVSEGGTGATDAATARSNLGANNASNLTTGTLPNARISGAYDGITTLSTSGKITTTGNEIEISGGSPRVRLSDTNTDAYDFWAYVDSNRFYVLADRDNSGTWETPHALELNASSNVGYLFGSQIITAGNYDGLGITPEARSIAAGNGLTGGGDLSANRTLTLGTPGNITNSTGNSVTSTSHTHALGFTAAEVYTGSSNSELTFPLGDVRLVSYSATPARNGTLTFYLYSNTAQYSTNVNGTAVGGTWRSRGLGGSNVALMQRMA
ncbi:hypothetical protein [Sinorhizobium medicae]|uniref:hypothetical protein n=1 Tax=Sinorhizobium medicae TaxID=110321 RepID=UPI00396A4091